MFETILFVFGIVALIYILSVAVFFLGSWWTDVHDDPPGYHPCFCSHKERAEFALKWVWWLIEDRIVWPKQKAGE